jgi:hypothetical protein
MSAPPAQPENNESPLREDFVRVDSLDVANLQSQFDMLVNEMRKFVKAVGEKTGTANDSPTVTTIEERLKWHRGIGWTAISVTSAALLFFI